MPLIIIALVTTLLLLPFLGTGDPVDMMELFNLVPVKEAARDGHWLMPTLNGMPRFEKPPLAVWVPAALVRLTGSESLWVLRLPSLFLAMLTAFATYGLGWRLFRNPAEPPGQARRIALFAALVVPALLFFNREARLASYDIFATAFATCCMFFLVSFVEAPPRVAGEPPLDFSHWLLCTGLAAVCLGLSLLSKGPAPPATVLVPFIVWMMIFHRRKDAIFGVLFVLILGAMLASVWFITIAIKYPAAQETWSRDLFKLATGRPTPGAEVSASLRDPWFYYLQIFLWVAPLTPVFVAGLVMPFLPSTSDPAPAAPEKRGRWLMWLVVVMGLVILSMASEKKGRYALQLLPFAALLCGAVWQEFTRVRAGEKVKGAAALVLGAQGLCFIVPGVAGVVVALWVLMAGGLGPWSGATGAKVAATIAGAGAPVVAVLLLGVLACGLWLWHLLARQRFREATFVVALCACMLTFAGQWIYRGSPETHTNPAQMPEAKALESAGPQTAVYTLRRTDAETDAGFRPWLSSLYFAGRILPPRNAEALAALARENPGQDLLLMLITGQWDRQQKHYVPLPAVDEELRKLEALTGREKEELGRWDDEGRVTMLLRFSKKVSPP